MANEVVTFTTDSSFGSLNQTTALTNSSGIATVTLSQASAAAPGATYVSASAAGLTASAGYSVGGGGGGPIGVTVGSISITATPASVAADGYSLITLKVTVLDAASAPIANQPVSFSAAAGTLQSTSAVTNSSGIAQVYLTAPTTVGNTNVTAFSGGVPASVLVTFVAGLPSSVAISMTATSVAASGSTTISAALKDFYGNAVGAGQTVTFGTSSTTGAYFTDLTGAVTTSATTDSTGTARVIYVAGTCTGTCTDYLTATAVKPDGTAYGTNLATLTVGGVSGAPTLTMAPFANILSVGTPVTVTARLLDATATAIPNAVVTFSVGDPNLGTLTPSSGTALTDANGDAKVTLAATGPTSGATTITASAQVGTTPLTASSGFSVGASSVTLSNFVFGVGTGTLSASGTTSMSVDVMVNGVLSATPMTVNFTSLCASGGKAVISNSATTVNGTATGSYSDKGCAGTDTVTATVSGLASLSANLAIAAPSVGSLQFVAASPTTLSIKGTGGIETSQVTFKVMDAGGNPLSGQTVAFGLSTTAGGITLTPAGTPPTATSDANGLVAITVNSGVVSTPVRVTATVGTLMTQSSQLTITTGIADQDSSSLAATVLNVPEGMVYDGVQTVFTVRLADHFNNPVPDGTAVNFTPEGGSMLASCTTINGACTSTFTSQAPRPTNGRVTVLAYAVGEESFTDLNGNGLADSGEMIDANNASTDMPEAFVDYNENGVRNVTEPYFDFNQNGAYNANDGLFNGVLCSGSAICSATKTIHVRKPLVITLSTSGAQIALYSDAAQSSLLSQIALPACDTVPADNSQPLTKFYLRVLDLNGNNMPVGTSIAVSSDNGAVSGASFTVLDSSACNSNISGCPTSAADSSLGVYSFFMKSDATYNSGAGTCTNASTQGLFTVKVTSPRGTITTKDYVIKD